MTARGTYRQFLRLLPHALRAEHGAEMEEAFLEALHDARRHGRGSAATAWILATVDVVAVAARSRLPLAPGPTFRSLARPIPMRISDLRFALRSYRRQPLPTLLVVGMLALGIAANVAVFSLVNGLFLRPFPFPGADRLVYLNEKAPKWNLTTTGINFPDYATWRSSVTLFDGIALYSSASVTISDAHGAERVEAALVTHNYLDVIGVRPLIGRGFVPDEDRPGGPRVVLISETLWRERFGASTDVTGKTLRLNDVNIAIAGVLPRHASFPNNARVWLAIQGDPNQPGTNYRHAGIGRLKAGVSLEAAESDLLRAHRPIWDARDKEQNVTPFVASLRERLAGSLRSSTRALSIAVALLLIVACANVAAVMLARANARRREIGIRLAVGASRGRLLQQLLVENVLLASMGGLLGLALGRWLLTVLVAAAGDQLPPWASYEPDMRLIFFCVVTTLGTAVVFGWAPALHAMRGDLRTAMTDNTSASTSSPGGVRTLSLLLASQFAMAAVLLVSAGLMLRALGAVRGVDPGFDTARTLTFSVVLPPATYRDNPARLAFWNRALDRLRALPGVESAGMVSCAPLTGCHTGDFFNVEGRRPLGKGEQDPVVLYRAASDGYVEAMGLRLAAGRAFIASDAQPNGLLAAVVNETFVRTFWPGSAEAALGKRLSFNGPLTPKGPVPLWFTVVGVTRDVKHYGLEEPVRPGVYFPNAAVTRSAMTFALRSGGDPEALTPVVRAAFRELDPSIALFRVQTTGTLVEESLRRRRLYAWTLGIFAVLACVLALGGSYGITSYLTAQRRREIGIRIAIGAGQREVVRDVFARSARTIIPGMALGIVAAVFLGRAMDDLLFGVAPRDPIVLTASAATLLGSAFLANWIPARRAGRIDPMASLRT